MGASKRKERENRWFPRSDAVRAFGVSDQVFERNYRPLFPEAAVRADPGDPTERRKQFDLRLCFESWFKQQYELSDEGGDPLLYGSESPALERYREERAQLARLDRLERERKLLPRDLVHRAFAILAGRLRNFGAWLQREHGREALRHLNETLDDCVREFHAAMPEGEE